jgi:hypothetical protein
MPNQPGGGPPQDAGTGTDSGGRRPQGSRQPALGVQAALGEPVQLLCEVNDQRWSWDVGPHVSLFPLLRTGVPQPAPLVGAADDRGRHRFLAIPQRQSRVGLGRHGFFTGGFAWAKHAHSWYQRVSKYETTHNCY